MCIFLFVYQVVFNNESIFIETFYGRPQSVNNELILIETFYGRPQSVKLVFPTLLFDHEV